VWPCTDPGFGRPCRYFLTRANKNFDRHPSRGTHGLLAKCADQFEISSCRVFQLQSVEDLWAGDSRKQTSTTALDLLVDFSNCICIRVSYPLFPQALPPKYFDQLVVYGYSERLSRVDHDHSHPVPFGFHCRHRPLFRGRVSSRAEKIAVARRSAQQSTKWLLSVLVDRTDCRPASSALSGLSNVAGMISYAS